MPETLDQQAIELAERFDCVNIREPLYEDSHEPSCEQLDSPLAQPDRLWTLQELAARYGYTGIRTVQNMRDYVLEARPDLTLQVKDGRKTCLTAQCVALLDDLKAAKESGIDSPQWVQQQKEQFFSPSPSEKSPTPAPSGSGGELATVAPCNPFLNGVGVDEAIATSIAPVESRIETLQTRKMERTQVQSDLSEELKSLALTGFQQGRLEAQQAKDEYAQVYEDAYREEVERLKREQQLAAIRAQAQRDVQQQFEEAKRLGNGESQS